MTSTAVNPAPPSGFGVPTPTTRTKQRQSQNGRTRTAVPASSAPTKATASLPPLDYGRGPFNVPIVSYDWRFWAIRGDESDTVLLTEAESVSWDDSSAVMTGAVTFRTPTWGDKLGIREGHEIRAEVSSNGGHTFTRLWTMRIDAPNTDMAARARTANLANELNRLTQSDDDFVYASGKGHPGGWRVDLLIRDICDRYGLVVAYCPVMTAKIKKWHLIDQRPLDVVHSALLREKTATGRKYAISLDWQNRVHVTPFRRPLALMEIGPQIIAATGSAQHDTRFATAVTVRADPPTGAKKVKGHKTQGSTKIAASIESPEGVKLYGFIHRNLYSPDANSIADAEHEGKLFLAAIAKPKRSFTVTMPGMPFVRRLDAFKVVLPSEGISQIVYVSDARHNLDGASGYTTDLVLDFDDPFTDTAQAKILAKLSDTAVARSRKAPSTSTTKKTTTKTKTAQARTSGFGVQTKP